MKKVTLGQKIKYWLVGLLGSLLVRVLICTLRVSVVGKRFPDRPDNTGIIFCFWHSQLLPLAYLYRNHNIHVLVSTHRDGEYIVRVTRRLGFGFVRGSSTRGGVRGLSAALDKLKDGIDVAVTPDGPRGPRHVFKPGALFLARESGAPISFGTCIPEKAWRLKSWDRFCIPKPFSRAVLVVSEPFYVPRDLTEEEMEAKRLELENGLKTLEAFAESELKRLAASPAEE